MKRTKGTKEKNTSSDALRLSGLLADLIAGNNPSNRSVQATTRDQSVQKWAEDIDRMLRLDRRSPDEAEAVIEWCQADSFWRGNILSGSSLRKQFDKLTLAMQRETQKGRSPGEVVPITRRIY